LLLVIDDLQWCDQETLEWLHFFLRNNPQACVLVVATVRTGELGPDHPLLLFLHSLQTSTHLLDIELTPLSDTETAELAARLTDDSFTPEQAARLYQETEGNPFFVVETVRAGIWPHADGTDTVRAAPGALPPRVQAIIEARLAQLSPSARTLAELAAVIGREFGFEVLVQASAHDEASVVATLDELWQRQIVREHGADTYDFSHDKIREVVYAGLSMARRRLLHRTVAQALESVYAADLERVAGQVAAHYEQAGLPDRAVPYYQRAARAAVQVYANTEAISLLRRGLALLADLPDSPQKAEQELALHLALGPGLVAAAGYGTDAVWSTYTRALALTRILGHSPNPAILRALALWHIVRRNYPKSVEMGEHLLDLAHPPVGPPDPLLYVEGHYVLGATKFWMGEFVAAHEHLTQAWNAYAIHRHKAQVSQYAQDPGPVCLVRRAFVLWYLGYPDQAQMICQEALSLAHRLNHPFTTGYTLAFAAWLQRELRAVEASERLAEQLIDHCRNYNMDYWLPIGLVLKGAALVNRGDAAGGMTHIHAGIDAYRASDQDLYRPYTLARLAEAHTRAGRIGQGMAALDEALASVAHHGDRWYAAELHRQKGELLHIQDAPTSVVTARIQQALDLARQQQAKSLELRAAMSLARLWAQQGRSTAAHALLTEVYDWFTEGYDTVDLSEARTLLARTLRRK